LFTGLPQRQARFALKAYITTSGHFLPGKAVDNNEIENILGYVDDKPSRLKKKILASNGIKTRHYAIDRDHNTLYSNAEMAGRAGEQCLENSSLSSKHIQMLCCATSQGDLILPGFGSMVQAQMGLSGIELHTSHGICSSSMMALKSAYTSLLANQNDNALVIASELASRLFKASRYEQVDSASLDFNSEFLRWMLSDGAGAVLLESTPRETCFRIDWIKSFSHADAFPVCMSVGYNPDDPEQRNWQDYPTYSAAEADGALLIRQDVRLLENVVKLGVDGFLRLLDADVVKVDEIDHVLCHFSSEYFKSRIFEMLEISGAAIPEHKWYTNLYTRGNTGCASIFIMLDEFRRTQTYKAGDKIICMVPESGRFNNAYMQLTVVDAANEEYR
jgi:3-oxoacyl-[acyl-carrier-protein] synthase-3